MTTPLKYSELNEIDAGHQVLAEEVAKDINARVVAHLSDDVRNKLKSLISPTLAGDKLIDESPASPEGVRQLKLMALQLDTAEKVKANIPKKMRKEYRNRFVKLLNNTFGNYSLKGENEVLKKAAKEARDKPAPAPAAAPANPNTPPPAAAPNTAPTTPNTPPPAPTQGPAAAPNTAPAPPNTPASAPNPAPAAAHNAPHHAPGSADKDHNKEHTDAHEDHEDHAHTDDHDQKEEPPKKMFEGKWWFWNRKWKQNPEKTFNYGKPLFRKVALLGAMGTTAAAMSTFETGTVLSRVPVISSIGNLGTSLASTIARISSIPMPGWLAPLTGPSVAVPASVAPIAGALASTALTIGGLYGIGRLWEKFRRDVLHEKIPQRSFSKRVLTGVTAPFEASWKLVKYTGKALYNNKGLIAGAAALATLLTTMGMSAPAAGILSLVGAGASKGFPEGDGKKESGGHDDGHGGGHH